MAPSRPELVAGTPAGTPPIEVYTLRGGAGLEVRAMTFGGIILGIRVPDRDGNLDDVALGFDDPKAYLQENPHLGAIVGRVANRIAGGRFVLDGKTYDLARNDGPNTLHGGLRGFDRFVWSAESSSARSLVLARRSPDGEEGFPGNLDVRVTYTLTDHDALIVDYRAETDAPTPVNLTQHTYFNLAGAADGTVEEHVLQLHAAAFTPVSEAMIPTGEIRPVAGTPFDFRTPTPIGARIDDDDAQLRFAGGYDHNFVLDRGGAADDAPIEAARVLEPSFGRVLVVSTTEPGVQLYSGNSLTGRLTGKDGRALARRTGLCLETQHFPDAPNQPAFPSIILRPGDVYRSRTVFRFTTDRREPW